ncbi:hypothetical protein [Protofrankia sp. BMG5.30]|uniref:hypothetical protein n=1 Tax=Protofrankia sp. BMG5.30 TaxID=1834514 RepID=UPI00158A0ECF|nr:hypothetical protein [Protofrankia sp. BMG5.30]
MEHHRAVCVDQYAQDFLRGRGEPHALGAPPPAVSLAVSLVDSLVDEVHQKKPSFFGE